MLSSGEQPKPVCAGCGEELRDGYIGVKGIDGMVRMAHRNKECHKKVNNGFIHERDVEYK